MIGKIIGGTVAGGAVVGVVAALTVWRAYVLTVLWAWFVVSTFALPALSIPAAIGLCLTLSMLRPHKNVKSDPDEKAGEVFAVGVLVPLVLLGLGYIVKAFM